VALFQKHVLNVSDYLSFSNEFSAIVLLTGLLLMLLVFFSTGESNSTTPPPSTAYWLISFSVILGMSAGLVAFTNPEGRFPWKVRDAYISVASRSIKQNIYEKLNSTPDLILLGSSISFTIPAGYFKERWGINAFNMAATGGGPIDFVNILNYVIYNPRIGKAPSTILAEIASPSLRISTPALAPVTMFPYMSMDQSIPAFGAMTDDLILKTEVSDSIFTLQFVDNQRWEIKPKFSSDGSTIRSKLSSGSYKSNILRTLGPMRTFLTCNKLDPTGQKYMDELIRLSHQYQFSVVFYRPPVNSDFYTLTKTTPAKYTLCQRLFNAYMKTLLEKNSNIFYKDLTNDMEIADQRGELYIDTHHLYRQGNILVLQALDKEIEAALQWARRNHK
jgi:hypothetical protein